MSSHEFPPSFQTCSSCTILYNVQRLSFQKLCQCNVDLRIDFNGIGTCFDIVNCQHWGFVLSCPVKSFSRRRDNCCGHVFELERPVLPRCCLGVKARQLRECSRLDERSVSSGCLGFIVRSYLRLCRAPVPAVQYVCQLSLQRILPLSCSCLLCFHNRLQLLQRLLLSSQLPLEIRHNLLRSRVNPSQTPQPEFQYPQYQKTSPPMPTCTNVQPARSK